MQTHKYTTTLAATLTLAALATPAAWAQTGQPGWVVQPNPDQQTPQLATAAAATPAPTTPVVQPNPDQQTPPGAPATIVHVTNPSNGFNWGDAGIGAAGALGLAMLTAAGALAIIHRRTHRTTRSPGAIS